MSDRREPEREIDERIADWVDGRLGERDRERFVAEMRVSPQLRKDVDEYEKTVAAVRAALRAPTTPVNLADRVLAAVASGGGATQAAAPPRSARSLAWSVAAAAALLVVAVWVNAWGETPDGVDVARNKWSPPPMEKPEDLQKQVGVFSEEDFFDGAEKRDERTELAAKKAEAGAVQEELSDAARLRADIPATPAPAPSTELPSGDPRPADPSAPGAEAPKEEKKGLYIGPPRANDDVAVRTLTEREMPFPDTRASGAVSEGPGAPGAKPKDVLHLGGPAAAGPRGPTTGGPAPGDKSSPGRAPAPIATIPLVVVEGRVPPGTQRDAGEERPKARGSIRPQAGGDKSLDAKVREQAGDAPAQLDVFFRAQMASVPADRAAWSVRTLQFTPLPGDSAVADRRRADSAKEKPSVEQTWLVEGTKDDVGFLLQRLALFTAGEQYVLTNGEAPVPVFVGAAKTAEVPLADQEVEKSAARVPAGADRKALVLRFRALPR